MTWTHFHPSASVAYSCEGNAIALLHRVPNPVLITEFLQRWNVELNDFADNPVITPRLLCALSLASSNGNPTHYLYVPSFRKALADVGESFLKGSVRDVYAEHGLFACPLPLARLKENNPKLSREWLHNPANAFHLVGLWIALFIRSHIAETQCAPDPLQIALHVHGSNLKYTSENEFRMTYRGDFLPNFIRFYNSFPTQGSNHVKET